jgi:hypothetical protein
MSHFTVLVKVDKDRLEKHDGNLEAAVGELLAPYQENNMGDCPREYMEFNDVEDEYREEFETKTVEVVVTPDGEMLYPWDTRFNHPVEGDPFEKKRVIPDDCVVKEITMKEKFGDFDTFMQEWAGYRERNPETGKYGYWENPNKKWDWWQIGGRWRGMLRLKEGAPATYGERSAVCVMSAERDGDPEGYLKDDPHMSDIARVGDIDFEGMDLEVDLKIDDWWPKYQKYLAIKRDEAKDDEGFLMFDIPHTLQNLGIIKCVEPRKPMVDADGKPVLDENGRQEWTKGRFEEREVTLGEFKTDYRHHWEFGTYAVVDQNGQWHEKGEMGWWGISSETPESAAEWNKSFMDRWIRHEDPDTMLAVVDCHI